MPKYCSNCGKKLEEGKTCDCVKIIEPQINNNVNEIITITKNIFIKPVDVIKESKKEKHYNTSLILVIALSIITGLFSLSALKNCYGLIMDSIVTPTVTYARDYNINLPYAQTFFTSVIGTFVLSYLFVAILYIVNTKIFKGKSSFKSIFNLYATISVVISLALIISAIFMYINPQLALIILLLGLALNLFYMIIAIKFIGPKDENMHGYLYITTMAIFYFLVFLIIRIFS